MTAVDLTEGPEVEFRPVGHPVAWFATVLTAVAVLLWMTWWAGLVSPRVAITTYDLTNEAGFGAINGFDLRVANSGPLAAEVVGAGLTGSPARRLPAVRIDPGEEVVVHLPVKLGECGGDQLLRVEVRSPVGLVRSIELPTTHLGGFCPA